MLIAGSLATVRNYVLFRSSMSLMPEGLRVASNRESKEIPKRLSMLKMGVLQSISWGWITSRPP